MNRQRRDPGPASCVRASPVEKRKQHKKAGGSGLKERDELTGDRALSLRSRLLLAREEAYEAPVNNRSFARLFWGRRLQPALFAQKVTLAHNVGDAKAARGVSNWSELQDAGFELYSGRLVRNGLKRARRD